MPGAVEVDWTRDLNDQVRRDYLGREGFERLAGRIGITPETTVVFYGDKNNWWASYAYWVFHLFGHTNARLMDGGRLKWQKEGRELVREVPEGAATRYQAPERNDEEIRAYRDQVLRHVRQGLQLVDVRSPGEYSGELLHMPDYPNEGALRGGHIPGAHSIPWARAINPDDGTFKSARELREIYENEKGLRPATTSSSIAGSASARATRGSCSRGCWATRRCATTTAAGPSGVTWSVCRSRSEDGRASGQARRDPGSARDARGPQ